MNIKDPVVVDNYSYASPAQRIIAFLIDYVIAIGLAQIFVFGKIVSFVYLIFRDAIPGMVGKSIGKKVLGIKAIKEQGSDFSYVTSFKRNIFFLPNLAYIFILDKYAYYILLCNFITFVIEIYLLYATENSERLGDQWAGTSVVEGD